MQEGPHGPGPSAPGKEAGPPSLPSLLREAGTGADRGGQSSRPCARNAASWTAGSEDARTLQPLFWGGGAVT